MRVGVPPPGQTPQSLSQYGGGSGHSSPHGSFSGGMSAGASGYGRYSSKLTPQESEIIDVAFECFKNDEGFITTDRLIEAFTKIEALGDIQDIKMLIDDIDENGDGQIDETEFRHIMTRKFLGQDDDSSFVHTFEMMDENKDGYIPLVEMRYAMMNEGAQPLSEQECDEMLMFADLDGDGLVHYPSFLRWLGNPDASAFQMRH